jgi:hypothetical protein
VKEDPPKKTVAFAFQGHMVTLHILNPKPMDDAMLGFYVSQWGKQWGKKKLTSDIEVTLQ